MNFKEKVKELIDKGLEENPSLFLIDYIVGADNLIKVTIDGDNGVSIEDCVALSRAIEHNLDREEQDFSLEVASCGIFAPLTQERQYVKNIGRDLQLKTNDLALEGNINIFIFKNKNKLLRIRRQYKTRIKRLCYFGIFLS